MHFYKCELETMFLAVQILDLFLYKYSNKKVSQNMYLISATAITIASKMQDVTPVQINSIKGINEMELFMFQKINYQIILVSPYDFIKSYLFDFYHNSETNINKLNMKKHLKALEETAILIAKIMFHDESFYQFRSSSNAIACLLRGFDVLRTNSKNLPKDVVSFIKQWVIINYHIFYTRLYY